MLWYFTYVFERIWEYRGQRVTKMSDQITGKPPSAVALIFAGGSGTRMRQEDGLPKQFIEVAGIPILVHTLQRFQECDSIDAIYLVVPPTWTEHVLNLVMNFSIFKTAAVVPGGNTALESIFCGLQRMVDDGVPSDAVVAIHDGVRPIVTNSLITTNVETARSMGNAVTSIPAFETVALRQEGSDIVENVVDRHRAYVLQAPQTYHLGDVYDMNLRAQADGTLGKFVDQANMQSYYGKVLHLVEGFRGNVKITIPDDVRYFTYLVETGEYDKIVATQPLMERAS